MSAAPHTSPQLDQDFINGVLARHAGRPGSMLAILQQIQNNHPRKYLPLEALEYVASKTGVPCPGSIASRPSMRSSI